MKIRIATRKSKLARLQVELVAQEIRKHHPDVTVEEVLISTEGDRIQDKPLYDMGGKALFIAEVEAALVHGEADVAVHSLKDVPGDVDLADGYDIVSVPAREDPRDVLVTAEGLELDALEPGSRVGTTSLRRTCQLRARRPDLVFDTLRGNVQTRLSKLDSGQFAAAVLAAAGLKRLGLLEERRHWMIPPDLCVPAVGQGTLALEAHLDDEKLLSVLCSIEDHNTRVETEAERILLRRLQGSCRVPIAGFARYEPERSTLSFEGLVGSIDGERILQAGAQRYLSPDPETHEDSARELGAEVAESLLSQGARQLMNEAEATIARQSQTGNGGGKWH